LQSFLLGYYPEEVKGEIQWRWKNLKWLLEVNVKRPSKECKAKGSSTRSQ